MLEPVGDFAGDDSRSRRGRSPVPRATRAGLAHRPAPLDRQLDDRAAMEDLALDRASLEHVPLRLVEPVEPRAEEGIEADRKLDLLEADLVERALIGEHRDELLGEQRVAGRHLRQPRREGSRAHRRSRADRRPRQTRAPRAAPSPSSPGLAPGARGAPGRRPAPVHRPAGAEGSRAGRAGRSAHWMSSTTMTIGRSGPPPRESAARPTRAPPGS